MGLRSRQLSDLLSLWKARQLVLSERGISPQAEVESLVFDTRQLQSQKSLFFARRGSQSDGHLYLKSLSPERLVAVVVEDLSMVPDNLPVIEVRDSTEAMAWAAKELYGDPSAEAFMAAVTGTNGKTTSTFLLKTLLDQKFGPAAVMGTIETGFGETRVASELTTPDFSVTQKLFHDLKEKGAKAFVMEASSHALDQRRLLGLELDLAVFTNLSSEHLDYHKTLENYFLAKKRLFSEVLRASEKTRKIVVCPDDGRFGTRLIEDLKVYEDLEVWTWRDAREGKMAESGFVGDRHADLISASLSSSGSSLELKWQGEHHRFETALVGLYNVWNVVGAVMSGWAMGLSSGEIQEALERLPSVPGRLELVGSQIYVDYAHTPDALENVLQALRPLCAGRLKLVFGCGGDRDRSKRPLMAEVAELQCDEIFVTSDNPRTEDPLQIIEEIKRGFQFVRPIHIEPDREHAIRQAVQSLAENDILLIAGKGHETYQIIGHEKRDFDDRKLAQDAWERRS